MEGHTFARGPVPENEAPKRGYNAACLARKAWEAAAEHSRAAHQIKRRKRAAPGGKSVQWWQKARMAEEPEAAGEAAFLWSLFPEE